MNSRLSAPTDLLRDPEYTGENRCLPCTAVNVGLALALAGAIGYVSVPASGAALVASLGAIYFRGYLVPGTPTLTKRYLPGRVLAAFGKQPVRESGGNVGTVLRSLGVAQPVSDGDDVRLAPAFERDWREENERLDRQEAMHRLGALIDADPDGLTVERTDEENGIEVAADGDVQIRFESRRAMMADLAALPLLRERDDAWSYRSVREQADLLAGLRGLLESCLDCNTELSLVEESVETCCAKLDVVTLTCPGCESRLFEVESDS